MVNNITLNDTSFSEITRLFDIVMGPNATYKYLLTAKLYLNDKLKEKGKSLKPDSLDWINMFPSNVKQVMLIKVHE